MNVRDVDTMDKISRADLRKRINSIVVGDVDLEAFCCDHFPEVKVRFSAGMERTAKVTLLLEHADLPRIVEALDGHCAMDSPLGAAPPLIEDESPCQVHLTASW